MTKVIKFIDTVGIPEIYHPKPSKMFVPDWYKESSAYVENKKEYIGSQHLMYGHTTATIKKCMPVFDSMFAGYIIPTPVDIYVRQTENGPIYESSNIHYVGLHNLDQAEEHPYTKNIKIGIPKWISPWGIKTEKEYSCLFISPMHRESLFTNFEGIVDTDIYDNPVQFPFSLKDNEWSGVIPAGTPMVQVIPFKRDSFFIEISNKKEDIESINKTFYILKSKFINGYKEHFWKKKEYN